MAEFIDPVDDPTGLLPSAGTPPLITVSEQDTLGREPTSKTNRLEDEANTVVDGSSFVPDSVELFADSVSKSFTSGGNWAYELYKRAEREALSPPPDPTFKAQDFITRNRDRIPQELEMQYHLATSENEANLILSDMNDELRKQEILARRGGFSTFVAAGLAGIVDLDTPLAVLSGGASSAFKGGILATRWGKLASSAATGALTQAAAQTVAFEAGTTGDWTSIPAAGLGGLVFGAAGGGFRKNRTEHVTNDTVHAVTRDFDEYVADGAPLAQHDIRKEAHPHEDPYGSQAAAAKQTELRDQPKDMRGDFDDEEIIHIPADTEVGVGKTISLDELNPRAVPTGTTMRDIQGEEGGSIGARQMQSQGSVATIQSPRITQMITAARNWANRTGIVNEYNDKYVGVAANGAAGDAVAKWASRMHDMIAASPMATDFDRLWRSGSIVAQRLSYDLLESASGIVRNNRSAANLMEMYKNQLGIVSQHYDVTRKLWDKENGISTFDSFKPEHRQRFNREVQAEMAGRAYDPPGTDRGTPPSIKLAADAIDDFHKKDVEIGKGRPGEGSIKGYEFFDHYSGYMPQKWNGASMEKMIHAGKSVDDIIAAVAEAYVRQHNMKYDDAKVYASAVVNRARRNEQGMDTNLIGILQGDGKEFLSDTLRANGVSASETARLIDKLTGEAAVRGQQGHTKQRIDIDMRFTASNGVSMLDLVDNDVGGMLAQRVRNTAGAAALARKGIASRSDIAAIKEAILAEQAARGPSVMSNGSKLDKFNDLVDRDKHLTGDDIDALFSNFLGGAIAGGLSPFYASMKKLTNLVLLPQLGLTQMSELGAQMSSVGLKRWFEHAGGAMRGNAINPQSELSKELRHMGVMVPENRYFRNDLNLDMDRQGPGSSWFAQKMQSTLNSAQHLQGYTSLYFQVRNFQQRVAVTSAADKIMRNMAGLANDLSAARAADIGLDPALYARIQRLYVNPSVGGRRAAAVEFRDGSLYKANFHKWNPKDAEDFTLALNRHVNQVVQKAMAGESSILFHKDGIASLFFHMKTFSLLAVEKQALRNVRLQDGQAVGTFFAGLTTAAAAYAVKQGINGNTQNMTLDKIARGAIGYSNMTGWMPMWSDPVAEMLGLEALKLNTFGGTRGQPGTILSTPASLSALNSMLNIPAIAGHAVTGNWSNNDVRALQATPIIGKAYGITYFLNSLKD
ncbi:hypothetical protein [Bradyrhizobium retamae]|uniref:Internal virion protein n=1 Tax=Bradyrhizobium retamae TaxID=1300035 RepID=A0A0R3MRE3_9BRAD|nr:hypothetical protein [Bradyrhizobium retamae]KRR22158.1 hypothetical protein CQ13_29965 [Bradyrhizobium retamae]